LDPTRRRRSSSGAFCHKHLADAAEPRLKIFAASRANLNSSLGMFRR
jgi:hypothetical protein